MRLDERPVYHLFVTDRFRSRTGEGGKQIEVKMAASSMSLSGKREDRNEASDVMGMLGESTKRQRSMGDPPPIQGEDFVLTLEMLEALEEKRLEKKKLKKERKRLKKQAKKAKKLLKKQNKNKPSEAPPPPPKPVVAMIELWTDDRCGTKVKISCPPDATIKHVKELISAKIGRAPTKIRLQKANMVFQDLISIQDYDLSPGMSLEMYYN